MKGKTKKIVLAVAVIGAIAAGGVAFTAANTVPDSVAGYGTNDVSGATVTTSTTPCRRWHDTSQRPILRSLTGDHNLDTSRPASAPTDLDHATPTAHVDRRRPQDSTCSGLTGTSTDADATAHRGGHRHPAKSHQLSAGGRPGTCPAVPLAG